MDRIEETCGPVEAFLKLLRTAVHEDKETTGWKTEDVDWEGVFRLASEHQVQPLLLEKAVEHPGFAACPGQWNIQMQCMGLVAGQSMRTESFLELYRAFREAGVYPLVMKGLLCRQLYGELQDHRVSGDEDILIRKEEFPQVKEVLERQGFYPEWEKVTEGQLEELQEVTFTNHQTGLVIEVHTNPMGRENSFRREMNGYFKDVWERYREVEINGTRVRTLGHTDHFLFLVLHTLKHFTSGGFGIRQVLDILLYEEQFGEEIRWDKMEFILRELGADAFYADLHEIGNEYLSFSLPLRFRTKCPQELLEDMMEGGVFGNGTQAERTAAQMTGAAMRERGSNAGEHRIRTFWRTIFPSREQVMSFAPEVKEQPLLLYVEWVKRWGRFLRHSRQNGGNLAAESMKISQRRIQMLKKYKIL